MPALSSEALSEYAIRNLAESARILRGEYVAAKKMGRFAWHRRDMQRLEALAKKEMAAMEGGESAVECFRRLQREINRRYKQYMMTVSAEKLKDLGEGTHLYHNALKSLNAYAEKIQEQLDNRILAAKNDPGAKLFAMDCDDTLEKPMEMFIKKARTVEQQKPVDGEPTREQKLLNSFMKRLKVEKASELPDLLGYHVTGTEKIFNTITGLGHLVFPVSQRVTYVKKELQQKRGAQEHFDPSSLNIAEQKREEMIRFLGESFPNTFKQEEDKEPEYLGYVNFSYPNPDGKGEEINVNYSDVLTDFEKEAANANPDVSDKQVKRLLGKNPELHCLEAFVRAKHERIARKDIILVDNFSQYSGPAEKAGFNFMLAEPSSPEHEFIDNFLMGPNQKKPKAPNNHLMLMLTEAYKRVPTPPEYDRIVKDKGVSGLFDILVKETKGSVKNAALDMIKAIKQFNLDSPEEISDIDQGMKKLASIGANLIIGKGAEKGASPKSPIIRRTAFALQQLQQQQQLLLKPKAAAEEDVGAGKEPAAPSRSFNH